MTTQATQYSDEVASAGQDIADAGAPITFTRTQSTRNESTGVTSKLLPLTASSSAIRVKPYRMDYMRLESGGMTLLDPVTLLVAGLGLAFDPMPNDTFAWGPNTYTVRTVDPVAPDGTSILLRVIGSR